MIGIMMRSLASGTFWKNTVVPSIVSLILGGLLGFGLGVGIAHIRDEGSHPFCQEAVRLHLADQAWSLLLIGEIVEPDIIGGVVETLTQQTRELADVAPPHLQADLQELVEIRLRAQQAWRAARFDPEFFEDGTWVQRVTEEFGRSPDELTRSFQVRAQAVCGQWFMDFPNRPHVG